MFIALFKIFTQRNYEFCSKSLVSSVGVWKSPCLGDEHDKVHGGDERNVLRVEAHDRQAFHCNKDQPMLFLNQLRGNFFFNLLS